MNCTSEDAQQEYAQQRPRSGRPRRSRARAGFTLVEMMVAVVILTVGLLGLASTSAVITRQVGGSATQTVAAQVIANRFERFRSLDCARIGNGSDTTRGVVERWTRGPTVNRVLFVVDTVTYSVAGTHRVTRQAFTIAVPCQ